VKRVLSAVVAVVCVLASAAPAQAAGSTPEPTLSVTTTVLGAPLPVPTMRGSWTVARPGRRATLHVRGPVVSGTVTTVHSSWTSAWRWTRPKTIAMSVGVENDFQDVAGSAAKNRVVTLVQARRRGHQWQDVQRLVSGHSPELLMHIGFGFGLDIGLYDRIRLQWRVSMTATFTDTSTEGLTETVHVA
jgi:hypothetical protein